MYQYIAYRADINPNINICITKADGIALGDCVGRCYCHVAMYIAITDMYITVLGAYVIAQWKMVNPLCESIMCGRCYCQVEDFKSTVRALCVADVISRWRLKPTRVEVGRCYSQVADGIATVLF